MILDAIWSNSPIVNFNKAQLLRHGEGRCRCLSLFFFPRNDFLVIFLVILGLVLRAGHHAMLDPGREDHPGAGLSVVPTTTELRPEIATSRSPGSIACNPDGNGGVYPAGAIRPMEVKQKTGWVWDVWGLEEVGLFGPTSGQRGCIPRGQGKCFLNYIHWIYIDFYTSWSVKPEDCPFEALKLQFLALQLRKICNCLRWRACTFSLLIIHCADQQILVLLGTGLGTELVVKFQSPACERLVAQWAWPGLQVLFVQKRRLWQQVCLEPVEFQRFQPPRLCESSPATLRFGKLPLRKRWEWWQKKLVGQVWWSTAQLASLEWDICSSPKNVFDVFVFLLFLFVSPDLFKLDQLELVLCRAANLGSSALSERPGELDDARKTLRDANGRLVFGVGALRTEIPMIQCHQHVKTSELRSSTAS